MAAVTFGLTGFAALLHPAHGRAVTADRQALDALQSFHAPARPSAPTPAERVMHSPWLNLAIGGLGLAYLIEQRVAGTLAFTLDTVNLLFLSLAVFLHPSPASLAKAAEEAARPLHGVVLQFPLYAGIYGIIKDTALASALASLFLVVASARTFPFIVFCYSAVLNYWVPSGGAKWAMEAAYVLKAGGALEVPVTDTVMAYAYGDMATNLIQPFWAIPLLGVARLEFRDILGYEILMFLAYSMLIGAALLLA
jgi:short-chain fatty acids transporter